MTHWITIPEQAYFDSLLRRRADAREAVRRSVTFADGTAPRPNDCHANTARWSAQDGDLVPAHGWLIEADDGHFARFVAHSLLRSGDGALVEITPLGQARPRFLEHEGAVAEFFALLPRNNSITWPLPQAGTSLPAVSAS